MAAASPRRSWDLGGASSDRLADWRDLLGRERDVDGLALALLALHI